MKFLVTGSYGFIGYSVAKHLLEAGHEVVGVDRKNNAISVKEPRILALAKFPKFTHKECDLGNYGQLEEVFRSTRPKIVIHMAAQYAVAPLTKDLLDRYIHSNCKGFANLGWLATQYGTKRVVYASSTFVDDHEKDIHTYGATKRFNESMAGVFAYNSDVRFIGIRYGSTFGPECRSDVGIYKLMQRMFSGTPHPIKGGYLYQTAFLHSDDAIGYTLAAATGEFTEQNLVFTAVMDDYRYSLSDLARMAHAKFEIPFADGQDTLPMHNVFSKPEEVIQMAGMITGYMPKMNMKDSITQFGEWFRENRC